METMEQKTERNCRVQGRYDELMREGKHGHYETMFRVVREEVERERERLKADAEEWGDALNSAGWAMTEAYRTHTGQIGPQIYFNNAKAILRDGIAAYFAALKA